MIFTIHFGVLPLFFWKHKHLYGVLVVPTFRSMAMMPFVTNSCVFFCHVIFSLLMCFFFVIFVQDIVQTVEDLIFEMGHSVCFKRGRGGTSTDLKSECS